MSAEEPRKGVGGDGPTDDGLECGSDPLLACSGFPLLPIEPMEAGRGQAALGECRNDLLGRQLCAAQRVKHPLTGKGVIEA